MRYVPLLALFLLLVGCRAESRQVSLPAAERKAPEIAWAKLKAMAEGARLASKQLWK